MDVDGDEFDGAVAVVVVDLGLEGDVEEKTKTFDRVLISVGRKPNSAGLDLILFYQINLRDQ